MDKWQKISQKMTMGWQGVNVEINSLEFEKFRVDVLNRLESLHHENEELTRHVVQVKTTLFGANGDPGRLAVIDKRLDAHTKSITRIMQLLWPIIGALILFGWLGLPAIKVMLR